jgi:hypothetical protein
MKTVTGVAGFKSCCFDIVALYEYFRQQSIKDHDMNNGAAEINCHLTKCQKLSRWGWCLYNVRPINLCHPQAADWFVCAFFLGQSYQC